MSNQEQNASPFLRNKNKTVFKTNSVKPKPKPKPTPVDDEFRKNLRQNGKLNWKKAPKEIKVRYYGMYAILFSIPILAISTYEMYRRLEGKSTKKVQEGEILEDKTVRKFDEVEKWEVEKKSLMYRLFGRDFFLDGFTSKTMKKEGKEQDIRGSESDVK
ncbi:hypothetical protein CLIB1423_28S00826 [[Candida] railenensis]|uniref:Uncharacterized protein n=1 Tax=[Candida] railenensis TaxID=45579 RepID=A0A9P0W1C4_9ASCO|nr:hypothetical protein CLIB1423_28S00826 [[Candida] railenensis]